MLLSMRRSFGPLALVVATTVAASGALAAPPVQPLGVPAAPAREEPVIRLKNLDQLAELTKDDPAVHPLAQKLVKRSRASWATFGLGVTGGALVSILGMSAFRTTTCEALGDVVLCTDAPNWAMTGAGVGVMALSTLVGLALMPKHDEILGVVDAWNSRR
jgi:hypothetical protein